MRRAQTARTMYLNCTDSLGRQRIARATVDCAGDVFVTMPDEHTWFDPQQMGELLAAFNELRALSTTLHLRAGS